MDDVERSRRMAEILRESARSRRAMAEQLIAQAADLERDAQAWQRRADPRTSTPQTAPQRPRRQARPLTAGQQKVLDAVPIEWTGCQDIADAMGWSYTDVYPRLKALHHRGLVERRNGAAYGHTQEGRPFVANAPGAVAWRHVPTSDEQLAAIAADLEGVGDHLIDLYDVDEKGRR